MKKLFTIITLLTITFIFFQSNDAIAAATSNKITTVSVSDLTPDNVFQGQINTPLLTFTARSSESNEKLNSLKVQYTGTNKGDVSAMYLYRESNVSQGAFNPTEDALMATETSPSGNEFNLNPPQFSMAAGTDYQFYIVADIASNAVFGNTVDVKIRKDKISFHSGSWPNTTDEPLYDPTENSLIIRPGSLTIVKDSQPDDAQDFEFINNLGANFFLDDDSDATLSNQKIFTNLLPGVYSVAETALEGWDGQVACDDGSPADAVAISEGEDVVCTFTNTKRGSLAVTKIADPNAGLFTFNLTGPTLKNDSVTGSGALVFENLIPGNYTLTEILPEEWDGTQNIDCDTISSPIENGVEFTVSPGDAVSCTFNNTEFASISGKKFHDLNANGSDDNEPGLFDWTIRLLDENEEEIQQAGTDGEGMYFFENLAPGDYIVCETQQENWIQSSPLDNFDCEDGTGGYDVSLSAGENELAKDFGNYQKGSISGVKFEDTNGNGARDEGEQGLLGWIMELTNQTGELIASQTTDVNGTYAFLNLMPDNYQVREVLQDTWTKMLPTDSFYTISLSSNESLINKNFGNFKKPIIRGIKWYDVNADGVKQETEHGIEGWQITLSKVLPSKITTNTTGTTPLIDTEMVALSLTGVDGSFSFAVDKPGEYHITEEAKTDWRKTFPADSFFDIFVEVSGQEITKDKNGIDIAFGNVRFVNTLGGKFEPANGNSTSTPSIKVIEPALITVNGEGEASSTVSLENGTVIKRSDGGDMNINDFTANSVSENSLTGLAESSVIDGALQWGIINMELEFNPAITIKLFVGQSLNGNTLNILRSTSGTGGWTNDGIEPPKTCLVTNGFCEFKATKASFYAATHTTPANNNNNNNFSGETNISSISAPSSDQGGVIGGFSSGLSRFAPVIPPQNIASNISENSNSASPNLVSKPSSKPQVLGVSTFKFNKNLRAGMKGNDVLKLQKRLKELGIYKGPMTGFFGNITKKAVKKYQKSVGLKSTGLVNASTRKKINDSIINSTLN